jgi:hypothetical protein
MHGTRLVFCFESTVGHGNLNIYHSQNLQPKQSYATLSQYPQTIAAIA